MYAIGKVHKKRLDSTRARCYRLKYQFNFNSSSKVKVPHLIVVNYTMLTPADTFLQLNAPMIINPVVSHWMIVI
jgi:hypothetical protein